MKSGMMIAAGVLICSLSLGCLNVGTPREISVNTDVNTRQPVDASSVPPTATNEECRQKLAEAYSEIRYLRDKVDKLDRDKKDLKRDRDSYKKERDDCRKQVKQEQKNDKKMRKQAE